MLTETESSARRQTDVNQLDSEQIQLWTQSGTMIGSVRLAVAQLLIERGNHFVISGQAIGEK